MPNYQLAKIYQLICNTTGRRYIGATCQKYLSTRLAHHVSKKNTTTSKEIIEGRNYEMVLIESYPCSSKDEMHQRERLYIQSMECVNKYIPCRTKEEKKEQLKDYYDDNRKHISEYQKDYRQQNKDKIQKYKNDYRQQNRDIINQKQRERYQAKKQTPEDHRAERREYWQSKKEIQKVSLSPTE